MMHPKVARIGASEKKTVELLGTGGRSNGVSVPAHILAITEEQIEDWNSMAGSGHAPVVHVQSFPSTAWVIVNPFGRPPVGLQVFDSANQPGGADVENAPDWSQIIIRVSNAMTGTVVFS